MIDTHALLEPDRIWDVLIVGAGPAGAASAITLARNGWRVLIVEKQATIGFKFGESLPPDAVGVVEALIGSLAEVDFARYGIAKTAGNISCWQSAEPDISDFFYAPNGFGLCINRTSFDQLLISQAQASGARLLSATRFRQCQRRNGQQAHWAVEVQSDAGREWHQAKYLVDCSGRQAFVAKRLGIDRQVQDRLFAFGQCFVAEHNHDNDRFTRVEATAQGWWYSNRLLPVGDDDEANSQRLVVFHTDRDLAWAKQAATPAGFADLLSQSRHITMLLKKYGYQPKGTIRGASAASERLSQFAGDSWMAVGDAAQAYDPLSSQGISKALHSATMAGQLIHYALNSLAEHGNRHADLSLFRRYANEQERLWSTYRQQQQYFYHSQPRWPDQPFWARRGLHTSGAVTTLLGEAP